MGTLLENGGLQGQSPISQEATAMWKKVEMGAPLSYPCYLCLSGPGLLVLLLLPWGPAAQSTTGESA